MGGINSPLTSKYLKILSAELALKMSRSADFEGAVTQSSRRFRRATYGLSHLTNYLQVDSSSSVAHVKFVDDMGLQQSTSLFVEASM